MSKIPLIIIKTNIINIIKIYALYETLILFTKL